MFYHIEGCFEINAFKFYQFNSNEFGLTQIDSDFFRIQKLNKMKKDTLSFAIHVFQFIFLWHWNIGHFIFWNTKAFYLLSKITVGVALVMSRVCNGGNFSDPTPTEPKHTDSSGWFGWVRMIELNKAKIFMAVIFW